MSTYEPSFWDGFFRHFDSLEQVPAYGELLERVATLCDVRPGDRVLDAGTGTGNLLARLVRRGARPTGIDANDRGLLRAKTKSPQARLVHASLEQTLPFASGSFSAAAMVNVLYTLSPAARATCLAELRRVLGKGRRLVIATPREGQRPLAIYRESVRRWIREDGLSAGLAKTARFLPPTLAILYYSARLSVNATYTFFREDDLVAEIARAGFEVESVERGFADQVWIVTARA